MNPLAEFEADWPAISALLDEALGLPEAARTVWLDTLAGERARHRDALRRLLGQRGHVDTRDFLHSLPRLDVRPANAPAAGDHIGAYRLLEPLGHGGMGSVWLAERTDGLVARRVALKLPHAVWGEAFAERLAREREILATLEHEHIARLYDAGIDAHGRPFMAMEVVAGEPLDAHCRAHALPLRERIALLLQVMAAVSHAHAQLVIHRDLKPGNILVTADGRVKLLDFGVAKLLEGEATRRTALTELTGRALTPEFASPEQIRGEPLGTASDVYSLAVIAYELLAGARPYRLRRGTAAELEDAIAQVEPRLASDAAVTPALRKALRGDLDAILNRGLKKRAAERYPNVESFAQDLRRHLRGEPVLARPDSRAYRMATFVRRHRLAVGMATALAVAIVAGAGVSLWQARVAREQERRMMAEFEDAGAVRELYLEAMMRLQVMASDDPVALTKPKAVARALRDVLDEMAPRLAAKPVQRDAQLYAVALQFDHTEDFESAYAVGLQYLDSLKAHGAPPHQVVEAYGLLGGFLFRLRRMPECEAMRRAGVAWSPGSHDLLTEIRRQRVASGLGSVLRYEGKRQESAAVFEHAEQVMAVVAPRDPARFENLKQFAMLWLGWDDARALRVAQQARDGVVADPESNAIEKGQAARALAYALQDAARPADAEPVAREALAQFTGAYGLDNRNTIRAVAALADAIARQGDRARSDAFLAGQRRAFERLPGGVPAGIARMLQEQSLENAWLAGDRDAATALLAVDPSFLLAPASLGENDLAQFWPLHALALAGRGREALDALAAYRATITQDVPTLIWMHALATQARLELATGQPALARESARRLLALLTREKAATGNAWREAAELAALAAARLGDTADAARSLALADAPTVTGAPASRVERAESLLRRAEVLAAVGRRDESVAAARAASADLEGQAPSSPRLEMARRLAAPTAL